MKLNIPGGGHITFDDSDEKAVKIRQGYGYHFENGIELVIEDEKKNPNFELLLPKLKTKKATLNDVQEVLAYLLDKLI